ncbi:MAG TPA: MFS transporter, partial [Ktedonobacterales bacterium]|nr:MFS transporter [Ktedonobacterales bacterium]
MVVAISAAGLFLGAPLVVFAFSVFFKPMVADFHASRAAVSFAFSLSNTAGALSIPCLGVLIDRFGAKRLIVVSTVVYGGVLCAAVWVGSSLWQLYVFYALLNVAMTAGAAPVPYGVVISHWFNRYRGIALGLSMMGIGVGSIVVPILAQRLIAMFGWRSAFAVFGIAVVLLPLPVLAWGLQNDPALRGLQPDGDERVASSHIPVRERPGMSWHEIWHNPTFWLLLCIFSLAGACVHGVALHMAAIFTDRGVSAAQAAKATSLLGGAVL